MGGSCRRSNVSDKPRVIYFDIRGRAEPIRLLLEEVGTEYTNDHADLEWMTRKKDTPFGVLPIYEHGSLRIPESQAILRHLARVHDLYGDTEDDRVRCDIAEEALVDAKSLLGMFPWRANAEGERETFEKQELPETLGRPARPRTRLG
jgi:glutathione S-transferase